MIVRIPSLTLQTGALNLGCCETGTPHVANKHTSIRGCARYQVLFFRIRIGFDGVTILVVGGTGQRHSVVQPSGDLEIQLGRRYFLESRSATHAKPSTSTLPSYVGSKILPLYTTGRLNLLCVNCQFHCWLSHRGTMDPLPSEYFPNCAAS